MSTETIVIAADRIGKSYAASAHGWRGLASLLGVTRETKRWVFRDVSLNVRQGEAIGIVGANGSGKSTLLKILTGTTLATEGTLQVNGKISALLELGMGFHGDFTGRQNAYLAGQMQGLAKEEIDHVIDWIRGFAEIGDYFEEPVRTYSSGMFVRLAFSVATAYRPQLLIIDEALAVGDIYFQHKSFARIREFHEAGTSLLFVSHDPLSVKSLCQRALLLGDGRLLADGDADDVLDFYSARIAEKENRGQRVSAEHFDGRSGSGEVRIIEAAMLVDGQPSDIIRSGDAATIRVTYLVTQPVDNLNLGFLLKDRTGYDVFGTNTTSLDVILDASVAGHQGCVEFELPDMAIGPGSYSLTLALHSHLDHFENNYDWWERALVFRVMQHHRSPRFVGVAALEISARQIS